MLEKLFKLQAHQTTVRKELIAGLITFLTMSYVLVVIPNMMGETGMDKAALFTATALACIVGTLLLAFLANIPVAQAPGLGLNSFFVVTIVQTMGYSWQFALTAVFLGGLIFILLTLFNVREIIVDSIPPVLKNAIPVGIGLYITFIGLQLSGIITTNAYTMIGLGDLGSKGVWVALLGLFLICALMAKKVPGAMLIGMLVATGAAVLLGVTSLPQGDVIAIPPSIAPVFAQFEWDHILSMDMFIVVFTLVMVNLFDSLGTLIGVAMKAGLMDKDGNFPQIRKALLSDAIGATIGSVLGVSTMTVYVESTSGVAAGGRTGLTSVGTAILFFIALFFSPLFLIVPAQATAPALIIVGLLMLTSIVNINFDDWTESLPAYLTIIMMPFAFSISQGIVFGILGYILMKLLTGRVKDVSLPLYIIGALFLFKMILEV